MRASLLLLLATPSSILHTVSVAERHPPKAASPPPAATAREHVERSDPEEQVILFYVYAQYLVLIPFSRVRRMAHPKTPKRLADQVLESESPPCREFPFRPHKLTCSCSVSISNAPRRPSRDHTPFSDLTPRSLSTSIPPASDALGASPRKPGLPRSSSMGRLLARKISFAFELRKKERDSASFVAAHDPMPSSSSPTGIYYRDTPLGVQTAPLHITRDIFVNDEDAMEHLAGSEPSSPTLETSRRRYGLPPAPRVQKGPILCFATSCMIHPDLRSTVTPDVS